MSHDRGWRAACLVTIKIPEFHFDVREEARGVTAMVVGSGALLGRFFIRKLSHFDPEATHFSANERRPFPCAVVLRNQR